MALKIMNITLDNFKSFKHVEIDTANRKGKEAKPLVCIYGENGSGKTNLINSLLFLHQSLQTMSFLKLFQKLVDNKPAETEAISDLLHQAVKLNAEMLDKEYHYIDDTEPMKLTYTFLYNDAECIYELGFEQGNIVQESLMYKLKKKLAYAYKFSGNEIMLSPSIFKDEKYNLELKDKVVQYWGKHSFMAIIVAELLEKNRSFSIKVLDESFISLVEQLEVISVVSQKAGNKSVYFGGYREPFNPMEKDTIDNKLLPALKQFEVLLNIFYTSLYTDILEMFYITREINTNKLEYELFVKKQLNGEVKIIPFELESNGTKKLLRYLPFILECLDGKTVLIDEMDNGIHDLLFNKLIIGLRDVMTGQLIITTHNTTLLEGLQPKEVYIIQKDSDAEIQIECVNNYKIRTQRTHNIRDKYLRGDYEGVPYPDALDLEFLQEKFLELKKEVAVNG